MKFFILELNEFNHDILKKYSKKFNYKNIKNILNYNHTVTFSKDKYIGNNNQNGYLDPWSQWVSIHTSQPSKTHKIKNLGDIPKLKIKQFWERNKKINFYIWGSMNASRRGSSNVKLFFPDPWVFSEKAYPREFNKLFNPIKKTIKTRGGASLVEKIKTIFSLIFNLTKYLSFFTILKLNSLILLDFVKYKKNYIFFCIWEYLCLKILLKKINKKKNFVSIYFINSLAHVQHHYWRKNRYTKEIKYCLKYLDKGLSEIFKNKNLNLIIINGLSQKNSEKEQMCLYEQINHEKLLETLNIKFIKIEKLMTNDAYIFFKAKKEMLRSMEILKNIKLKNENIFHIEIIDDKKIFYKTNFLKKVSPKEHIISNNLSIRFFDYFKFITLRRGIHTENGDILSSLKIFPPQIENHKIFNYLK